MSSNQPTGRWVAHDKHVQGGATWARRWAETGMWRSSTLGDDSRPSRTDVWFFLWTVSTSQTSLLRVVEKAACGGRHALLDHGPGTSTRTAASLPVVQVPAPPLTT